MPATDITTKLTVPIVDADNRVTRTVRVTHPGRYGLGPVDLTVDEVDQLGTVTWTGIHTRSIPEAFQAAFDRAAYGLRVQNRRTW